MFLILSSHLKVSKASLTPRHRDDLIRLQQRKCGNLLLVKLVHEKVGTGTPQMWNSIVLLLDDEMFILLKFESYWSLSPVGVQNTTARLEALEELSADLPVKEVHRSGWQHCW